MSRTFIILVADDDENDLAMTLAALTSQGDVQRVCAVHEGAEALDFLYSHGSFQSRAPGNPELVLLDLHMPRVDGWGVLRQIKSDATLKTIPVIIFTSSARERDVQFSYELGANAYVVKPIDYREYKAVLTDLHSFWLERNAPPPGQEVKDLTRLEPLGPVDQALRKTVANR